MTKLVAYIQSFLASREGNEEGATMVEYGLMVALIAVVAAGAVKLLGVDVKATFDNITAAI
jgi:pilus assembly protein Flp/PilA